MFDYFLVPNLESCGALFYDEVTPIQEGHQRSLRSPKGSHVEERFESQYERMTDHMVQLVISALRL